jgi:hypothetical protein
MGEWVYRSHFVDHSISLRRVVSFTPRSLYPRIKNSRCPLDRKLIGPQTRRSENSWHYRDSNSDPSVAQPAASCYADCATATFLLGETILNFTHNTSTQSEAVQCCCSVETSDLNAVVPGRLISLPSFTNSPAGFKCSWYLQPALETVPLLAAFGLVIWVANRLEWNNCRTVSLLLWPLTTLISRLQLLPLQK